MKVQCDVFMHVVCSELWHCFNRPDVNDSNLTVLDNVYAIISHYNEILTKRLLNIIEMSMVLIIED